MIKKAKLKAAKKAYRTLLVDEKSLRNSSRPATARPALIRCNQAAIDVLVQFRILDTDSRKAVMLMTNAVTGTVKSLRKYNKRLRKLCKAANNPELYDDNGIDWGDVRAVVKREQHESNERMRSAKGSFAPHVRSPQPPTPQARQVRNALVRLSSGDQTHQLNKETKGDNYAGTE